MEQSAGRKKIIYLIVFFSLVLLLLIGLLNFFTARKSSDQKKPTSVFLTPTSVLTQISTVPLLSIVPQTIKNVPTFVPEKGKGVDIESKQARDSIAEIQKLSRFLPYTQDLSLSTGLKVSIVIPPAALQDNLWTLTVQIFGVDYGIPASDPDYSRMKSSFKEAASIVFLWMKGKGVDPGKMIISWGDKAFIQKRTQEWIIAP